MCLLCYLDNKEETLVTYVLKRPSQRTAASESEAKLARRIDVSCIVRDTIETTAV